MSQEPLARQVNGERSFESVGVLVFFVFFCGCPLFTFLAARTFFQFVGVLYLRFHLLMCYIFHFTYLFTVAGMIFISCIFKEIFNLISSFFDLFDKLLVLFH